MTRRAFLASGAAALAAAPVRADVSRSIAIIDWALLETALALGIVPAAASELMQYRNLVVEPEVPDTVVADLGLRGSPNFEMLRQVEPDLIVISQFYDYQRPQLERIAPVLSLPVYDAGTPPYALVEDSTLKLGEALGIAEKARAYVTDTAREIALRRTALTSHRARPVFIINLGDSRHFRAFGGDSMFGDVLGRLGMENAWSDTTSYSAAAPVGIEALARVPDAGIVIVDPSPPEVARGLPRNAIWNALPAVREGRVATIAPVSHFGGLPSARRFARLTESAMSQWPVA
ncbi:ABC transporter substrate-binding protein [Aliihoeflea aestuarii]|uniref:ABC transporter substrate-binding protein n=1 Tax=Aliihoeflea aestuarii TaxID=453840 RepID=UPI002092C0F2|nr:ABC transporter substrate-binding protein [Aliihoeflea aestuarii]